MLLSLAALTTHLYLQPLPIKEGFPKGLAIHIGKILECAAICALPGSGSDCMFGYASQGRFRA